MTYGICWPVGPDLFMRPTPFLASRRWRSRTTHWAPFCTLTDMGAQYVFEAEIPGAIRENLKLTVQASFAAFRFGRVRIIVETIEYETKGKCVDGIRYLLNCTRH